MCACLCVCGVYCVGILCELYHFWGQILLEFNNLKFAREKKSGVPTFRVRLRLGGVKAFSPIGMNIFVGNKEVDFMV